jgi:PadR family transcriptional regulator, regulatory protein PadR
MPLLFRCGNYAHGRDSTDSDVRSGLGRWLFREIAFPVLTNFICVIYFFVYIEDMRDHNYLGEFELMLLLTLIRLGDEAYGVPLARELALMRGRDVSIGSVYAALDRLELKGLVASSLGESTPERGGRAKRYFHVTEQGLRSVHDTRKVLSRLWKSLPSVREDSA